MNSLTITPAERAANRAKKITGAGDVFALIAQPIAKAIDSVAGTDIANCQPCAKRRAAWNAALPIKSSDGQTNS